MILHRLSGRNTVATAFNGDGSRKYGGRWNRKGTAVVYAASTLALSALEVLVHTDSDILPDQYAYTIEVPDGFRVDHPANPLPPNWFSSPAPDALQDIGSNWVDGDHGVLLRVPSAVIQSEWNYLIDPTHAEFVRLTITLVGAFHFDPRLRP